MTGMFPALIGGGIGLITLGVFISAIRISYAIERTTKPDARFPRYTNVWANLFGWGVSPSDQETMALVWKLRRRMSVVAILFLPLIALAYGFNA